MKEQFRLKWISGDLYFSFLIKARGQSRLLRVLSSWILETLMDRDFKASGQTFLLLGCPQGEKVFLIFWVKLMIQLLCSSIHLPTMYFRKSLFHLLAYLLSGTDKLYWNCHFPGWTSPFSHLLLIDQALQLKLFWTSTGLSPGFLNQRAPKLSRVSRWDLIKAEQRGIGPPFNVLALSPWLLPQMLLVISTAGAHCLLIIGLCLPGFTGLFLQTCPKSSPSLYLCTGASCPETVLDICHCCISLDFFVHFYSIIRSLWMTALISCILTLPARVLSSTKLVRISSIGSSRSLIK